MIIYPANSPASAFCKNAAGKIKELWVLAREAPPLCSELNSEFVM